MAAMPAPILNRRPPSPRYDPTDPSTWGQDGDPSSFLNGAGGDPNDPNASAAASDSSRFLANDGSGGGMPFAGGGAGPVPTPGVTPPPGFVPPVDWGVGDTTSPGQMAIQNRNLEFQQGTGLANQTGQASSYFGRNMEDYRNASNQAFTNLANQPGYTPDQAGQINADYGKFNTSGDDLGKRFLTPDEQSKVAGNPYAPMQYYNPDTVRNIAGQGASNMANTASQEAQWLSGNIDKKALSQDPNSVAKVGGFLGQARTDLTGAVQGAGAGVNSAVSGAKSGAASAISGAAGGIGSALGTEATGISKASDNPALQLDPSFLGKYQMSDKDVQDLENQAGTSIGNKYQTDLDTMNRQAAAQGNTSPLALEAARQSLLRQEGGAAADATTNARIAAKGAQAQRLQTGEGMRLGATQTQAGMQQQGAEALGQQGVNAQEFLGGQGVNAALATGQMGEQGAIATGQLGVGAGEFLGAEGVSATQGEEAQRLGAQANLTNTLENAATTAGNQYMNASTLGEQALMQGEQYAQGTGENLTAAGEAASANRAAGIAGNRQATTTGNQNTQYAQGTGSQQMTSQGAQTVGNAEQTGMNNYRNFLASQQGQGQQGYLTSTGQQLQNYGVQSGALNNITGTQAYNMSTGTSPLQWFQGITGAGAGAASAFFKDGGVATEPTEAILGEDGPEAVVPVGDKSNAYSDYAKFLRNKDTMAGVTPEERKAEIQGSGAPVPQGFEDGGVAMGPTDATLAENGPEVVLPLRQAAARAQQEQRSAGMTPTAMPMRQPMSPYGQRPAPQNGPPGVAGNVANIVRNVQDMRNNRAINQGGQQAAMNAPSPSQAGMDAPGQDQPPAPGAVPSGPQQQMSPGGQRPDNDAYEFMAGGRVVTKPTRAILAENGQPEAVVPLSPSANARLKPAGFLKSMYRRPTGPAAPRLPMKSAMPLVPGRTMR